MFPFASVPPLLKTLPCAPPTQLLQMADRFGGEAHSPAIAATTHDVSPPPAAATTAAVALEGWQRYQQVRILGQGAFGVVHLARDLMEDGEPVAVKCVALATLPDDEAKRAMSEVAILRNLSHRHVLRFLDCFIDHDTLLCLVTEFVDGGDLCALIKGFRRSGHFIDAFVVADIGRQLLEGLAYLHKHGILHRDFKPANVYVTRGGTIKIGDFGVSKMLTSSTPQAATFVGTPFYMCPELCVGEPYSYGCDVWAFGVMMYELYCGKLPFHASNVLALINVITEGSYDKVTLKERPFGGSVTAAGGSSTAGLGTAGAVASSSSSALSTSLTDEQQRAMTSLVSGLIEAALVHDAAERPTAMQLLCAFFNGGDVERAASSSSEEVLLVSPGAHNSANEAAVSPGVRRASGVLVIEPLSARRRGSVPMAADLPPCLSEPAAPWQSSLGAGHVGEGLSDDVAVEAERRAAALPWIRDPSAFAALQLSAADDDGGTDVPALRQGAGGEGYLRDGGSVYGQAGGGNVLRSDEALLVTPDGRPLATPRPTTSQLMRDAVAGRPPTSGGTRELGSVRGRGRLGDMAEPVPQPASASAYRPQGLGSSCYCDPVELERVLHARAREYHRRRLEKEARRRRDQQGTASWDGGAPPDATRRIVAAAPFSEAIGGGLLVPAPAFTTAMAVSTAAPVVDDHRDDLQQRERHQIHLSRIAEARRAAGLPLGPLEAALPVTSMRPLQTAVSVDCFPRRSPSNQHQDGECDAAGAVINSVDDRAGIGGSERWKMDSMMALAEAVVRKEGLLNLDRHPFAYDDAEQRREERRAERRALRRRSQREASPGESDDDADDDVFYVEVYILPWDTTLRIKAVWSGTSYRKFTKALTKAMRRWWAKSASGVAFQNRHGEDRKQSAGENDDTEATASSCLTSDDGELAYLDSEGDVVKVVSSRDWKLYLETIQEE